MKNKSKIPIIVLILVLIISATLVALPVVNAHDPALEITTHAFIVVSPNPIGINQQTQIVMCLLFNPPTGTGLGGDRWTNFEVTVTRPNGETETLGPFTSDSTGSTYTLYTPTQVGEYTFKLDFPGQVLSLYHPITNVTGQNSPYIGDTFLPSSATTTITVQEEPIKEPPTYPLPTEYWSHPIEGQNTAWYQVASNWLGGAHIIDRVVQLDGIAPNSGHVMWTKPIQDGGVVGGTRTGNINGTMFYSGLTYETKFNTPLIMNGRLYYELPQSNTGTGGGYVCVDLRTGEEIYYQTESRPSFGQLYNFESMNQHGTIPNGYLWKSDENPWAAYSGLPSGSTTWSAYDTLNGQWLFNLTNVPSGTDFYGSSGELQRYVLNYTGRWLALWDYSEAFPESAGMNQYRPVGQVIDVSKAYAWNVTISELKGGTASPTIVKILGDDMILGRSTNFAGMTADGTPGASFTMWAISLEPNSRGNIMWQHTYDSPLGNVTLRLGPVDPINRVFTVADQEDMVVYGYSLDDGKLLWKSDPMQHPFDVYNRLGATEAATAYGNLYTCGYSGTVYCWSTATGKLQWTYGNGRMPGNDTTSGYTTAWGSYPLAIAAIADEKIYIYTTEHSPNAPLYKGALIRCLNAHNGTEVWTLSGWGSGEQGKGADFAVADGYLVYLNCYDMQIYCVGKGPSATAVTASPKVSVQGSSVLVDGSVIDISAGTKQKEQAARFPNGVPAVSDESISAWMEYVYMQKPKPQDTVGVPVKLEAVDPNNNYQYLGTTTSDTYGNYGFAFEPEIEGTYMIIATFEGSGAYYGSTSTTYITVDPAPAVQTPINIEEQVDTVEPAATETPFITTEVAIIAAVAIAAVIGVAAYFLLKRK
ncbi:MAG: PQQ-like beta-propeller repeat protein [Candidatus Bathyarchaeota archaeon]|nr:PQQ-like beta-propeller repeat protein [Candidatus Bathyarchaeum sp.]